MHTRSAFRAAAGALRRASTSSRAPSPIRNVGLIGLGAMGLPMAENLLQAGFNLTVYDVNQSAVEMAAAKGAHTASTVADAAAGMDAVITMVPNDAVLREVTCEQGLLNALGGGAVHISCSTVHPETSRELAALHVAAGSSYVGAPVFARADGVAQRLASFVVGGEPAAVDAAMPLLEANSNGVFRFGDDPGAGNVVKLCGNYLIATTIQSCAEALSLAEKSGLNRTDVMTMLK